MRRSITVILSMCVVAAVTASVVVAQSLEPPPYPEDAGVTFEPVGDAAWRIVEPDRHCQREPFLLAGETAVAPDGRVWLLDRQSGIRQLGRCPLPVEGGPHSILPRDQAVAPDGTLWVLDGDRLISWVGSDWTLHVEGQFNIPYCTDGARPITYEEFKEQGGECAGGSGESPFYLYLDIAPDGSIWLSGAGRSLGVYDDDGWREYDEDWMGSYPSRPAFGPDGAVWLHGKGGLYVFYP